MAMFRKFTSFCLFTFNSKFYVGIYVDECILYTVYFSMYFLAYGKVVYISEIPNYFVFQWYVVYAAVSRFYGNISAKTAENGIPYLIPYIICSKFNRGRNYICYAPYSSYCI
jgi:hypothetical protein